MYDFNIDEWINGYKVRAFPWIDKKNIYVNVQYYKYGSSLSKPPIMDKSVLITANEKGIKMIEEFLATLVENIARMKIDNDNISNKQVVLTFE